MVHLVEFITPNGSEFVSLAAIEAVRIAGAAAFSTGAPCAVLRLQSGVNILVNGTARENANRIGWIAAQIEPLLTDETAHLADAAIASLDQPESEEPDARPTLYQQARQALERAKAEAQRLKAEQAGGSGQPERF